MKDSNYLIDFSYKLDCLISEINKLNNKVRLCNSNAKIFNIDIKSDFYISPDYFLKLRDFLHQKIEEGSKYDRKIVELKRSFSKEYLSIKYKITKEINRLEELQEIQMNKVVYREIYSAKWDNENYLKESCNVKSSIFEAFLGIAKYRKLAYKNHQLKADIIQKEYNNKNFERKNIFELVNMIENADIKNGNLLCLQDDMIKAFMIDRNVIKRNNTEKWKQAVLIPDGIFEKRSYFKVLNQNLTEENKKLEMELKENRLVIGKEKNITINNLIRLNSKLAKIVIPTFNLEKNN